MQSLVYKIDGANFSTLDGFFTEFERQVIPDTQWGRNLAAFDDILRGGFGTPVHGFTLVWLNSELSRDRLGYAETARFLEQLLQNRTLEEEPHLRRRVEANLAQARKRQGVTLFDEILRILRLHGAGGEESDDSVVLELR